MVVTKVLRDNLWNRLFHKKELQEQRNKCSLAQYIIDTANQFLLILHESKGLHGLLFVHRELWKAGLTNSNLGPNEYGMFRTKDIAEMKPEEVFLGDIYGLWTYNIPEWEKHKEQKYGVNSYGLDPEITVYQIVENQYRRLLKSNIKAIRKENEEILTTLGKT